MRRRLRGWPVLALVLLGGCIAPPIRVPPPASVPLPDAADVEQVVFLLGDAGDARAISSPLFPVMTRDIEWWSEQLEGDSAVTVLFLGDIVYPYGLHPPGTPEYPSDSTIVMDQVELLAGPAALGRGALGLFLVGNHDWGLEEEWEGFLRLKNLSEFLEMARGATGANVRMAPEAGRGGPETLDVGEHVRLLMLDTAWWLLDGGRLTADSHDDVLARIEEEMATAGDREVFLAAHHPFRSGGPHGGEFDFWRTFGVRYLLARSGAILQDVTSVPYRKLEYGLREIFRRHGPPLGFIGGHEHSLQVLGPLRASDPQYSIVSGSGSKLSEVGGADAMYFGSATPGYMRLVIEKDGGITLFVVSAPARYQHCQGDEQARARCMAEGIAAYRTVHSQRLR
jgi:hypothetical protein